MIQVVLGPLSISESLLQPRHANTLPFAPPRPSYLNYGVISLDYESDICKEHCLVAVEHDTGFCRVDTLQNYDEVLAKLQSGEGLFNSYQIADSFMRNLAFKMGTLDKFGA